MNEKDRSGHHFNKREAAWAATGVVTLASILYVQSHKRTEPLMKTADPDEKFRQQAEILLEPRLKDKRPVLNRLAAHILHLEIPDAASIMQRMSLTRHKVSHLAGYLTAHQLIERVQYNSRLEVRSHYQPTEALLWAANRPEEFPELAASAAEFKLPPSSGNYRS